MKSTSDDVNVADFVNKIFHLVQSEKLPPNDVMYALSYTIGVVIGRAELKGENGKQAVKEVVRAIEYARKAAFENEKRSMDA